MNRKIEPRSLFLFLTVVFVSVIIIVGALGFYMGNTSSQRLANLNLTNTQDASAALDTAGAFDDGDMSSKDCAFNKGMVYCLPKYAFANQKSKLVVSYFPPGFRDGNPPQTPEWEITICKRKYTTTENYKEYSFRFYDRLCPITLKLLPGTELETVVTREYKPLSNLKNFKMSEPSYVKEIGVDYDATPIKGDLSADLLKKGISETMIEDVVWEYKYTSDYCSADVARDFTTKTKYSGFIHPDAIGRCRVKLTVYVVTCTDCTTSSRIVYTTSTILTTKVIKEGIMPSPTSYWYPPTITPTARPTPSVYPTISAINLEPMKTTISKDSEMEVSIIAMPPSDNIKTFQVRLKIEGATIVQGSYRTGGGETLTIGSCDIAGAKTTSDKVCVDVSGTSPFATNQKIGSFKILTNTTSPVLLNTDEGNAYYVDDLLYYSSEENLAEYTVNP